MNQKLYLFFVFISLKSFSQIQNSKTRDSIKKEELNEIVITASRRSVKFKSQLL